MPEAMSSLEGLERQAARLASRFPPSIDTPKLCLIDDGHRDTSETAI
jgi:hypothetical protein